MSANIILFRAPVLNQLKGGVSQAVLLSITPEDVAGTLLCFSSVVGRGVVCIHLPAVTLL